MLAYAVAALIVMTTLSRMIDNQRMQMGTLQALGFSAHQIKMHYLSYAIAPSAVGAVLGTLIGHNTLPFLLWDTLIAQNEMPYRLTPPISVFAWGMTVLSVVMSVFILLHSYKSAAKECTASLLRAKPPKSGKRILLERITWLWSRFSFNTKMVVRNLMRNKLRTVMMLVGLLCCTMLIITSLGLQDSVTSLSVKYYTKSLDYDVIANLTGEADKAESYERRADAEAAECLMEKSISLRTDAGTRTELMTVLEDDQTMIHLGENEAFVRLQTGTAAVTYKLTKTLNLHIGDVVRVYLPGDSDPFDIAIGQIVYNNVTQGVYLNRTTWESLRKGEFIPTGLMLKNPSDAYLAQLEDMDEVDSLDYPAKLIDGHDADARFALRRVHDADLHRAGAGLRHLLQHGADELRRAHARIRDAQGAGLPPEGDSPPHHARKRHHLLPRRGAGHLAGHRADERHHAHLRAGKRFLSRRADDPIHRHRVRRDLSVLRAAPAPAGAQGAQDRHGRGAEIR